MILSVETEHATTFQEVLSVSIQDIMGPVDPDHPDKPPEVVGKQVSYTLAVDPNTAKNVPTEWKTVDVYDGGDSIHSESSGKGGKNGKGEKPAQQPKK